MKKFLAMILSCTMMFCVSACSSESNNAAQEDNLEQFDIVLDWYPNAVHSFLYVGIEKGYYAEEGLDVNILFPANTNDAISLTSVGKADAGLYYQPSIIQTAANQNVPVVAIGTVVQHPLNIVLYMNESGIKGPSDLVGKTVGHAGTAADETFMKAIMKNAGYTLDDVNLIDVGFDLNTSLVTGNVDAIIGGYINHEYPSLINQGFDVGYFNLTDGGVPDYEELVLVTGKQQTEQESEKLAAFIRASKKAFEDVKADPYGSLDILLKHQDEANYPLNPEIEKASMDILLPLMESEERGFLEIDEQNWQNSIDWLKDFGLINNPISVEDILENVEG